MKLKHLAAFVFRILGALLILHSVWSLALLADSRSIGEASAKMFLIAIVPGLLGGNLIYFSKDLATIFCKDLDDDSA